MADLSWAEIRQAFETAAAELRKVEETWMEDADTATSAARSIDPHPLRYLPDPERIGELRQAIHTIEWFLDDMADADNPP